MLNEYYIIIAMNAGIEIMDSSAFCVTVCKKPHFDYEGILLSNDIYKATKFDPLDDSITMLLYYCRKTVPDMNFCAIPVNKTLFGNKPQELWSDEQISGDFSKTHFLGSTFVGRN